MIREHRRVVDAAVGNVAGKCGAGELRLREPEAGQPREVAGPGRLIAGKIAGDDLSLALADFARLAKRLDGHDIRSRGEARNAGGAQGDDDIDVSQNVVLLLDRFGFESVDETQGPVIGARVGDQFNGVKPGGAWAEQLVFRPGGAFPLHGRFRGRPRLQTR